MKIIGRKNEIDVLNRLLDSKKPEFVCVYGRRRVGKTFLLKQFFNDKFSFYITGIKGLTNRSQLSNFKKQLKNYGVNIKEPFKDWIEAFDGLIKLLESDTVYRVNNKRVVFIDETPWMDAPKSDFKAGLDYFWNSWASSKEDIIFIVCGSATSWIVKNLLKDTGGFYNRITKKIKINPFNVIETKELLEYNDVHFSNKDIVESYMVFGGIPYYLNLIDSRLSLVQNIDELFFKDTGELKYEKSLLLASLFKHHEIHEMILDLLYSKKSGLSKLDICKINKCKPSRQLSAALEELEQCGFIRGYCDYKTKKNNVLYQIIDPFILFTYNTLDGTISSWINYIGSPKYYSWLGRSFEMFCLNHISQIKETLGINGLITSEYSFTSRDDNRGAQIDLLIDRKDNVINLCEMKYSNDEYEIDKDFEKDLINKIEVFRKNTKTKKNICVTFVTMYGVKHNIHSGIVQQLVTIDKWL